MLTSHSWSWHKVFTLIIIQADDPTPKNKYTFQSRPFHLLNIISHICHFHHIFSPTFSTTGSWYSIPHFNIPYIILIYLLLYASRNTHKKLDGCTLWGYLYHLNRKKYIVACNFLLPCLVAISLPLPLEDRWSGVIPANCASLFALSKHLMSPISDRIFTTVITFTPRIVVSVHVGISYIFPASCLLQQAAYHSAVKHWQCWVLPYPCILVSIIFHFITSYHI